MRTIISHCSSCDQDFTQTYSPHLRRPRKFCSKPCVYKLNTLRAKPVDEAFFSYVKKTSSCWLWEGGIFSQTGYGAAHTHRKTVSAHRLSWELHNGTIPAGLFVCHSCDIKQCVNPSHLFLGTYRDNINDMVAKGRSLLGERHPSSKLSNQSVVEIRQLKQSTDITFRELAQRFIVNQGTIKRIVYKKAWRHI